MKIYTNYTDLPKHAVYLGSEDGSGCLDEYTDDLIARAVEPVRLLEDNNTYSYWDIAKEVTA
jgi:hypothetical protein